MPTPKFHGGSYQINPKSPADNQDSSAVAALDDGRFATVYRSDDTMGGSLRVIIHNMNGTVASKQTIVDPGNNDFVDNEMVDIAALKGGGFVVTWVERTANDENVYHRVYGPDGKPLTGRIHTNADATDGTAKRPDVVGDGNGGFYIVWDDSGFDNDPGPGQTFTRSVRYQHFGPDGQPTAPSEMISDVIGADSNAAIAINRDGSQVNIIWDDNLGNTGNNEDGIYGKILSREGYYRADGGIFSDFHGDPDIAYSTGDTYMVVWSEFRAPGNYAVHGSINGGPEFQINTTPHMHSNTTPKVVGLRDGNFLVVWNDGGHGGNDDVLAQLFSGTGAKIGDEFQVSDRASYDVSRITASETIDGRVIVTWSSATGPSEVYARMIDPRQGAISWTGGDASEQFTGTDFADTLDGGRGDDVIQGLGGADMLIGGQGNDTATYDLSKTGVLANLADPSANLGGAAGDSYVSIENLRGSQKADTLIGNNGANILGGMAGNDVIEGGNGADTLQGGKGKDVLSGGKGADTLAGGAGKDVFLFSTLKDSPANGAADTIVDFNRKQDVIDLKRLDADEGRRNDQAFDFIGNGKFTRDAGELRYEFRKGDTYIHADTDGNGKADFTLILDGEIKLTEDMFLL